MNINLEISGPIGLCSGNYDLNIHFFTFLFEDWMNLETLCYKVSKAELFHFIYSKPAPT